MRIDLFGGPVNIEDFALGGQMPVQASGTVDGHPFYMRLRGSSWLHIAKPGEDAVDVACGYEAGWSINLNPYVAELAPSCTHDSRLCRPGQAYTGTVSEAEARALLAAGLLAWREDREPYWCEADPPAPTQGIT